MCHINCCRSGDSRDSTAPSDLDLICMLTDAQIVPSFFTATWFSLGLCTDKHERSDDILGGCNASQLSPGDVNKIMVICSALHMPHNCFTLDITSIRIMILEQTVKADPCDCKLKAVTLTLTLWITR